MCLTVLVAKTVLDFTSVLRPFLPKSFKWHFFHSACFEWLTHILWLCRPPQAPLAFLPLFTKHESLPSIWTFAAWYCFHWFTVMVSSLWLLSFSQVLIFSLVLLGFSLYFWENNSSCPFYTIWLIERTTKCIPKILAITVTKTLAIKP